MLEKIDFDTFQEPVVEKFEYVTTLWSKLYSQKKVYFQKQVLEKWVILFLTQYSIKEAIIFS